MTPLLLALVGAFWLGVLTSIIPCPLVTNLAAISYVGRDVGSPSKAFLAGVLYTLGRVLVYVALAALLVASVLSSPSVSLWLQTNLNNFLGPLFILVGMTLLGLLGLLSLGLGGAGLLGLVFAPIFCPVSAALYLGSLLPLAVRSESTLLVPAVYGLGMGLPVLAVAGLLALGANRVGAAFTRLMQAEWGARRATGAALLLIGLYLTLHHVWRVV